MGPAPTKLSVLDRLFKLGISIDTVIDVGVLTGTPELLESLPNAKHLLFEPMDIYFDSIKKTYQKCDFELFNVACSDKDDECYLILTSVDGSGKITHSNISELPVEIGINNIVGCKKIPQVKLDSMPLNLNGSVLLKIDVDGAELKVLNGAIQTLKEVDVVILESPIANIIERATFMQQQGFRLFDICDICYYYMTLWQVDLVFIRQEVIAMNNNLEPMQHKVFSWSEYVEYSKS